jgi:hypothetical protein
MKKFSPFSGPKSRQHHVQSLSLTCPISQFNEDHIQFLEGGSKSFRPHIQSRAKWKMLRGIYSAIFGEVNISVSVCVEIKGDYIKNDKVVLFMSPYKDGQAGNFWTHPRTSL